MTNANFLQQLYETHHHKGSRKNFSIYEQKRGQLFSAQIGTGKKVLDLGCRDGTLTKYFSQNNQVTGVDIDKKLLSIARRKLKIQTKHLNLYDNWRLSGKFDIVVAGEVLEHLYHPEEVVAKSARWLKPDGRLLVSVPNAYIISARVRFLLGKEIPAHHDPTHINLFSKAKLHALLLQYFKTVTVTGFAPPAYKLFLPLSTSFFADDLIAIASKPK